MELIAAAADLIAATVLAMRGDSAAARKCQRKVQPKNLLRSTAGRWAGRRERIRNSGLVSRSSARSGP